MRVSNGRRPVGGNTNLSSESINNRVGSGSRNINNGNREDRIGYQNRYNKEDYERPLKEVKEKEIKHEKEVAEKPTINKDISKTEELEKLSRGRKVRMVIVGIISSILIAGLVWGMYYNYIRYPGSVEYSIEESGLGAINNWKEAINTLDNSTIKNVTGEDSYLAKELEYANSNQYHIDFIKKVVGTVGYIPDKVESLDKFGNIRVDENNSVIYEDSLVNGEKEKVTLEYIDYSKIPLDNEKIKSIMDECDLSVGDVDYSSKLVEVFCRYIVSLEPKDIPLVSVKYRPNLEKQNIGYRMAAEEDIFLDKELFSSESFYALLQRFSEVAGATKENPKWVSWNNLSDDKKKKNKEPEKYISALEVTDEWEKWNKKSDKEKAKVTEPDKYHSKDMISSNWCGAYYLLNEYSVTDKEGNEVKSPIYVL